MSSDERGGTFGEDPKALPWKDQKDRGETDHGETKRPSDGRRAVM